MFEKLECLAALCRVLLHPQLGTEHAGTGRRGPQTERQTPQSYKHTRAREKKKKKIASLEKGIVVWVDIISDEYGYH